MSRTSLLGGIFLNKTIVFLQTFKRLFAGFIALFFVIFAARGIHDLYSYNDSDIVIQNNYPDYSFSVGIGSSYIKNYATQRMEFKDSAGLIVGGTDASVSVLDQKYERIANIVSKTVSYDADLKHFNEILEENRAVVQNEQQQGLPGRRSIELVIGVRPENFDAMQEKVSNIGKNISYTITKTDKTYEYRQMLAEKDTLERRRTSYEELKNKSGSISELLQLEAKIIEVDEQIQQQLINLGEYSDDNALCTINFSLYEGTRTSAMRLLWGSFLWSTGVYMSIIGVLLFVAFAAFVIVKFLIYLRKAFTEKPVFPEVKQNKLAGGENNGIQNKND